MLNKTEGKSFVYTSMLLCNKSADILSLMSVCNSFFTNNNTFFLLFVVKYEFHIRIYQIFVDFITIHFSLLREVYGVHLQKYGFFHFFWPVRTANKTWCVVTVINPSPSSPADFCGPPLKF